MPIQTASMPAASSNEYPGAQGSARDISATIHTRAGRVRYHCVA